MKTFDHQDFQILELGSSGISWFWQLVQALHSPYSTHPPLVGKHWQLSVKLNMYFMIMPHFTELLSTYFGPYKANTKISNSRNNLRIRITTRYPSSATSHCQQTLSNGFSIFIKSCSLVASHKTVVNCQSFLQKIDNEPPTFKQLVSDSEYVHADDWYRSGFDWIPRKLGGAQEMDAKAMP